MGLGDSLTLQVARGATATMDSFVVMVYRREGEGRSAVVAGLVERTSDGMRRSFRTMEELWTVLAEPPPQRGGCRAPPVRDSEP